MSDDKGAPPDLEALDRSLSGIRFQPRASLGPEIEGRLRRGETPPEPDWWRFPGRPARRRSVPRRPRRRPRRDRSSSGPLRPRRWGAGRRRARRGGGARPPSRRPCGPAGKTATSPAHRASRPAGAAPRSRVPARRAAGSGSRRGCGPGPRGRGGCVRRRSCPHIRTTRVPVTHLDRFASPIPVRYRALELARRGHRVYGSGAGGHGAAGLSSSPAPMSRRRSLDAS